jgi:hypothetical protein
VVITLATLPLPCAQNKERPFIVRCVDYDNIERGEEKPVMI